MRARLCLIVIAFLAGASALAGDSALVGEDKVVYDIRIESTGAKYQTAYSHNIYGATECRKIERRESGDGTWMTFEAVYDPGTVEARSFLFKEFNGKKTFTTTAVVKPAVVEFTFADDTGAKKQRTLKREPGAPLLLDPLYTYYFAKILPAGKKSGLVQMIITSEDGFDDYLLDWKVLGIETVTVSSGTYQAYHVLMEMHNPVLRYLAPSNDFWYSTEGLRPLVKVRTKRKLTGPYLISEASQYTRIK